MSKDRIKISIENKGIQNERNRAMKSSMKKILIFSLCVCMLVSRTVYAQDESSDGRETINAGLQDDGETEVEIDDTGDAVGGGETEIVEPDGKEQNERQTPDLENGDVEINEANFPDENFRNFIKDNYDGDENGVLLADEISRITFIRCEGMDNISDLTGIQYFTSLERLDCGNNQITSLDLSKNMALQSLSCHDNQIASLDVSGHTALTYVFCSSNPLISIDLSGCTALTYLEYSHTQTTNLDVSGCTSLTYLNATGYWGLGSLETSGNYLTNLNVSGCTSLERLDCSRAKLTSLDVSECTSLKRLDCSGAKLTSLDVSRNTALTRLDCSENQLTSLDVRNCNGLEYLDVRPLKKTDVQYTYEPKEFFYGSSEINHGGISADTILSEIRVNTDQVNIDAIYKAFQIDPKKTNAKIVVEQKEADAKKKDYLTNYTKKFGGKMLNVYDVVMSLYGNGEYKGTVTDNFGNLTLSFYAGTEYKGRKATVYQLHGEDEVITYKDVVIDSNGMVTITVSKLSIFGVALQDSAVATDIGNGNNMVNKVPRTGDTANIVLWLVLVFFAMSAVTSVGIKSRK